MEKNTKNEISEMNEKFVESTHSNDEKVLVNEIKIITTQAQQVLLISSIEIGKRLIEAKKIIKHGEWGNWLKERVNFSQRTANNLMKIYNEYGENGLASNSQSIANLNYTQAMELLALPEKEREVFVENNNVKDMTIKELKETIKNLKSEKADSQKQIQMLEEKAKKYEIMKRESKDEINEMQKQILSLEESISKAGKKQDKEVKRRLEEALNNEKENLNKIEGDNKKLREEISALKKSYNESIEKAKEEEKSRIEKEFIKKENELKTVTKNLQEQLKKAEEEIALTYDIAENEKKKNKEAADIAKCDLLIEDILSKYSVVLNLVNEYKNINSENAEAILKNLNKSLLITNNKVNLKVVS